MTVAAWRLALGAMATALLHPRVWLTAWLLVTLPALVCTFPIYAAMDVALGQHPLTGYPLDQALDADFARAHPANPVPMAVATVFVLLAFAALGGGVLARVGRGRLSFSTMLADGGRLLPRNARALVIFAVLAMALTWGCSALDRWMCEDWLRDVAPGAAQFDVRLFSPRMLLEVSRYLYGIAFLLLVFTAKLVMARLSVLDRRSAALAWLQSVWQVLRHPLRVGTVLLFLVAAWLAASYAIGSATASFLEAQHLTWAGLVTGQLGVMTTQVLVIAALVAARELTVPRPVTSQPDAG